VAKCAALAAESWVQLLELVWAHVKVEVLVVDWVVVLLVQVLALTSEIPL
jgi:hypothetical protein